MNVSKNEIWAATWQNQQSDCAPSEDSDQSGHPPNLIRAFAARIKKTWVLSYPLSAQRRLWSDSADAQADLSLRWAHSHFVGFAMSRLIYFLSESLIITVKPPEIVRDSLFPVGAILPTNRKWSLEFDIEVCTIACFSVNWYWKSSVWSRLYIQ